MSYTPTEWATDDVITAEKLNNMEAGIVGAGGVFKVTATGDGNNGFTLNKTCGEIKTALMNGSLVYLEMVATRGEADAYVQTLSNSFVFYEGGGCSVEFPGDTFTALTDNDYPSTLTDNDDPTDDSGK